MGVPSKNFKQATNIVIPAYFETNWKNKLLNEDISRLRTYKTLNNDFILPKHLGLPYQLRKVISRIRCSNHPLAIEEGRKKDPKTPREDRLCVFCDEHVVEDEEHFLLNCTAYSNLRTHYNMHSQSVPDVLNMENQHQLANFLISTLELRQRLKWGREGE